MDIQWFIQGARRGVRLQGYAVTPPCNRSPSACNRSRRPASHGRFALRLWRIGGSMQNDDDALDIPSLQREALRAMARVLRATDAKPDTLLRAAEAIMRAEPIQATPNARRAALSDQDLLAIAQGMGVHPPEKGPVVPSAGAVPSDAPTVDPPTPPGLVLPAKGTQRGPISPSTPGGPTSISQIAKRGPKTDPPIANGAPQVASQIKIDDTPSAPAPLMPWE